MRSNRFVVELDRLFELSLVLQGFGRVVVEHELLSPLTLLGGHLRGGYGGRVTRVHDLAAQNVLLLARLAVDLCTCVIPVLGVRSRGEYTCVSICGLKRRESVYQIRYSCDCSFVIRINASDRLTNHQNMISSPISNPQAHPPLLPHSHVHSHVAAYLAAFVHDVVPEHEEHPWLGLDAMCDLIISGGVQPCMRGYASVKPR